MKHTEAIILAGGFGTRLQSVVTDLPKPMAPVAGRPFLEILLDYLLAQGITRVVLSVGYKHELIVRYFGYKYKNIELIYAIENTPLGTGGGIKYALGLTLADQVFILNGDTFFDVNLSQLSDFHVDSHADLTLSLKLMRKFDRYGSVKIQDMQIVEFVAKKYQEEAYINAGVYLINKQVLINAGLPEKFSYETDFMEQKIQQYRFMGYIGDGYFIDIGIPEDYSRAQIELSGK